MGTFLFKWTHPASEVFVTGTFDNWSKTEQLSKVGDAFEKEVTLKAADEKILYKFVVDGSWITDHTAPIDTDHQGNTNNVLTPDRIVKHTTEPVALLSSVGPGATTAALAGAVPLEKSLPGSFPVEPTTVSVDPIPATAGLGNPIKLEPGEKVPLPSEISANTIGSTVTTDKASYENSAAGVSAPATSSLDMPPVSKDIVPESSLPMGGSGIGTYDASPTISSVGPTSTTAALAGAVPLESTKVPEMVTESQKEAGIAPEAAAVPEAVAEKGAVEKELLSDVHEAPATSDGTKTEAAPAKEGAGGIVAAVGAGAVALGGTAAALAFGAKDKAAAGTSSLTSSLPTSVEDAKSKATAATSSLTSSLPTSVEDAKAKVTAATSSLTSSLPTSVDDAKSKVTAATSSLTSSLPTSVDDAKSKVTAATSSLTSSLPTSVDDAKSKATAATTTLTSSLPEGAKAKSGEAVAAVGAGAVALGGAAAGLAFGAKDKAVATPAAVKESVAAETPTGESVPEPAAEVPVVEPKIDSRDISPTTKTGSHAPGAPAVASGPATPATPAKPTAPGKFESPFGSASTSSATPDMKKKRNSFFSKLKMKFSDKDKK